jgi:hypothetical protein
MCSVLLAEKECCKFIYEVANCEKNANGMLSILYKQFSSDGDFHMNNLQDLPFAHIITNYPRMLLPHDLPICCECWLACRFGWLGDRISC